MAIERTAKNEHTLKHIRTMYANENYKSNFDKIDWSKDGKAKDPNEPSVKTK